MESTPRLPWKEDRYREGYLCFGPALLQLRTPDAALVLQLAEDGAGPLHLGGLPALVDDQFGRNAAAAAGSGEHDIDNDTANANTKCFTFLIPK